MAFFVAIVVPYLAHITCPPTQTILIIISLLIGLAWLGYMDSGDRVGAFWLPLLLIMLAAVFLLILPSLSRGFGVVRAGRSCRNRRLWAPNLRFFRPGVLRCLRLGISLGRGGVHLMVASMAVLIGVAAERGLYLDLGLSSCGFLNQGAPTVQLSAFFIDSQPNQWPQAFVEVSSQNFFSWGTPSVKFS